MPHWATTGAHETPTGRTAEKQTHTEMGMRRFGVRRTEADLAGNPQCGASSAWLRGVAAVAMLSVVVLAMGCPNPISDSPGEGLNDLVGATQAPGSPQSPQRGQAPRGRATVAFKTPQPQTPVQTPGDGTPPNQVRQVSETDRERLFQDWPKPKLAFAITGQQHGYIEPCGCTGLANQKGGMARRHTLFK